MAKSVTIKNPAHIDPAFDPAGLAADGEHPVSELATHWQGALSPFGDVTFPVSADKLPYRHPETEINRSA